MRPCSRQIVFLFLILLCLRVPAIVIKKHSDSLDPSEFRASQEPKKKTTELNRDPNLSPLQVGEQGKYLATTEQIQTGQLSYYTKRNPERDLQNFHQLRNDCPWANNGSITVQHYKTDQDWVSVKATPLTTTYSLCDVPLHESGNSGWIVTRIHSFTGHGGGGVQEHEQER